MAQSALTCTPPSPTPPTNFSSTGATPPNPPNFTKVNYTAPLTGPYFDDGTAGTATTFATNTTALASGTGATSGGTEDTYPGTGTSVSKGGAVPASTSVAHEGAGTEVAVTQTYSASIYNPAGPLVTVSCLGNFTSSPNGSHASTLSPATNPALASISPTSTVSGAGTQALTCTGTGFVPGCRIVVNGVQQNTTFVSVTSLTATVTKKGQAGTWPVQVYLGGVAMPVTVTWTFT